jgi:hypothetical protein
MVRRAVAFGVGLLLLLLAFFGIQSCFESRKENALKDYNREVSAVMAESDENAQALFEQLGQDGATPVDLQTNVNQLRVRAEEQRRRAEDFGVRDEVRPAHEALLLVLGLRQGAIGRIAEKIPTALGNEGADEAVEQIAGQMQAILASDVVYSQRVAAFIQQALNDAEIGGQTVAQSQSLPNLGWLEPATVAGRINADGGAAGGEEGEDGEVAPGLHGHELGAVSVGDVTLAPGGTANRIPASGNVAFDVAFTNGGENDETDVVVTLQVSGAGEPITVRRTVDQTRAGAEATVSIPLGQAPPIGTPVTIEVEIAEVPGEENLDNNTASFTALFTRGG